MGALEVQFTRNVAALVPGHPERDDDLVDDGKLMIRVWYGKRISGVGGGVHGVLF
jgi:hypothetical protein